MLIYRFNQYNKKYYCYDTVVHDLNSPMFDETLHDNLETPIVSDKTSSVCSYCGTDFKKRNRLFYHLGFMNINIVSGNSIPSYDYDVELGDYGIMPSRKGRRRIHRFNSLRGVEKKRCAKTYNDNITVCISKLSLN